MHCSVDGLAFYCCVLWCTSLLWSGVSNVTEYTLVEMVETTSLPCIRLPHQLLFMTSTQRFCSAFVTL